MGIKTYNPYTPSRRNMTGSDFYKLCRIACGADELAALARIKLNIVDLRADRDILPFTTGESMFRFILPRTWLATSSVSL